MVRYSCCVITLIETRFAWGTGVRHYPSLRHRPIYTSESLLKPDVKKQTSNMAMERVLTDIENVWRLTLIDSCAA